MPKFAANLSFFYLGIPFAERFAAAAKAGFMAVEFLFPFELEIPVFQKIIEDNNLQVVLFDAPAGDWAKGERGLGVVRGRDDEFTQSIGKAVKYANVVELKQINVLAGINYEDDEKINTARLIERLRYAADEFKKHDINLLLEHINPYDMPGYFVSTPNKAIEVIDQVKRDNVLLQYDFYHAQRMGGDIINFMKKHFDRIAHVQVADSPNRHQPGTGELNYKFILDELDKLGYKGWVGLEYKPTSDANGSLGWIKDMGYALCVAE